MTLKARTVPVLPAPARGYAAVGRPALADMMLSFASGIDTPLVVIARDPDALALRADAWCIAWANRAAEALTGRDVCDLVGAPLGLWVSADVDLAGLCHPARTTSVSLSVRAADDSWHDVQATAVPSGNGTWMVRLVPLLGRDAQTLAASEQRFHALAQRAPVATFLSEAGLRLGYVNDRFAALFGTSEVDLRGTGWLTHVHPDDMPALLEQFEQVLAGAPIEVPTRIVTAAGDVRMVQVRAEPVHAPGHGFTFVGTMEDVTERHAVEEALGHAARHDALTGLPNRMALWELLSDALPCPPTSGLALLFLDLDNFKTVNDSLGHDVGDQLLVEVAQRLSGVLRGGDLVARIGGDEFVVVARQVPDDDAAVTLATRLLGTLTEPVTLAGVRIRPSASVGVVRAVAEHVDAQALLRDGDVAMYQAKAAGKDGFALLDDDARHAAHARLRLVADLRVAIDDEALHMHYQPVVSLPESRLTGVEALIRWTHPELGDIPPSQFVPLAEEHGLIAELSAFALRTACTQAAAWSRLAGDAAPVVNVNLSAQQLADLALVTQVADVLATTGLPAAKLCLEITESAVMRDVDASVETLQQIRELGVAVAIDDFGTGYSSLAALRQLPVSYLKVDRSFVAELGDGSTPPAAGAGAVAGAVIGLARALHLATVAEGIEHPTQVEALTALGCTHAQGYHFSRPLPPQEVTALLTTADGRPPLLPAPASTPTSATTGRDA